MSPHVRWYVLQVMDQHLFNASCRVVEIMLEYAHDKPPARLMLHLCDLYCSPSFCCRGSMTGSGDSRLCDICLDLVFAQNDTSDVRAFEFGQRLRLMSRLRSTHQHECRLAGIDEVSARIELNEMTGSLKQIGTNS